MSHGAHTDPSPAGNGSAPLAPSHGYALHVDGPGPVDPATAAAIRKMSALLRTKELIRTGNAAVDKTGRVVDRREHPDAVPILAHNNQAQRPLADGDAGQKGNRE